MKTFRTLELAEKFYHLSEEAEIKGNLRDQLLRAASSIALNLAEGNAKRTEKEKKRYYQIAYGSSQECKTILKLAKISDDLVIDTADKLSAWVYNLLKANNPTLNF
jgi:four helix bundle protein